MDSMKCWVLTAPHRLEPERCALPVPGPAQVLVKVAHCGVCGSDVHRYLGHWRFDGPLILGHEPSGTVAALGECVTRVKPNDRVVVEPIAPCGKCALCLSGRYHLCADLRAMPTQMPGAFAEYVLAEEAFVHVVPETLELRVAALAEPLAVALHAVRQAVPGPGQTAAVLGAGSIGLLCVMALRAYGVARVGAADIEDARLDRALASGACAVANALNRPVSEAIVEALGGEADIVIEATGNAACATATPKIVAPGGSIVQVGVVDEPVPLSYPLLMRKEARLIQSYKYANDFPAALELLASGAIQADQILTHRFPFDALDRALALAAAPTPDCVKCMIDSTE